MGETELDDFLELLITRQLQKLSHTSCHLQLGIKHFLTASPKSSKSPGSGYGVTLFPATISDQWSLDPLGPRTVSQQGWYLAQALSRGHPVLLRL